MANAIKEATEIKNTIVSSAGKGFGTFFKNSLLIILVMLAMFISTNPSVILNPTEFLKAFDTNVIWVGGILFIIIWAAYQLAKDINASDKIEQNKKMFKSIKEEEESIIQQQKDEHSELIRKRIEASPMIRSELKDLLIKLGATRATICEMHNGTNNLNGLPFLYLDMTYEETSPKVGFVIDEYKNFNLAKYPFITNHINDYTWIGSVEDVRAEDAHLASKFEYADSKYGASVMLRGTTSIIGMLTVTFKDEKDHPSKGEIISALASAAQVISTLLDK